MVHGGVAILLWQRCDGPRCCNTFPSSIFFPLSDPAVTPNHVSVLRKPEVAKNGSKVAVTSPAWMSGVRYLKVVNQRRWRAMEFPQVRDDLPKVGTRSRIGHRGRRKVYLHQRSVTREMVWRLIVALFVWGFSLYAVGFREA
ncbi:hypothetical protein PIB30_099481 [Stylosanthes scabra]|uniref:Transmembrane protein n=1 Tax=Stylosanthes scabra TaxID=79078 RepID=A0ABU6SXD1_9FABA|nr:hypothetical protein [Stylosanthes scabra]